MYVALFNNYTSGWIEDNDSLYFFFNGVHNILCAKCNNEILYNEGILLLKHHCHNFHLRCAKDKISIEFLFTIEKCKLLIALNK